MIVSDAGPLIVLLKTNKLSILKELFGTINVPTAVYDEITERTGKNNPPKKWLDQTCEG